MAKTISTGCVSRRELLAVASMSAITMAGSAVKATSRRAERIRVGQIGTSHAHATKLSAYRNSADYEVVGVVEPDVELRRRAEASPVYAGLKFMTREELLNTSGLQVVLCETHVRDLLDAAEVCVAAGKHVHIDKPAGTSLPQFERILKNASKQKLIVQMGYMFRYNPGVVLLRKFLKEGWLGDVFSVQTDMSKVVDKAARADLAEFRGGILFELGCHVLDLVVAILGEPARVAAFHQTSGRYGDTLLDNTLTVLEYPTASATVRSSANEVEGFARRQITVSGTEGSFHIQPLDDPSATIALSQPRGDYKSGIQEVRFPKYVRYVDDAADMAAVIRGEKEFGFPPSHDLAVQRTLLKACGMPVDQG